MRRRNVLKLFVKFKASIIDLVREFVLIKQTKPNTLLFVR